MRMRRKRNLEPRLNACSSVIVARDHMGKEALSAIAERRYLLSYEEIFGNNNPVYLELGCGLGAFCIEFARRNPNVNILAVERISNVLVTATERALKEGLPNLRFMNMPVECLEAYIPDESVSRIFLNFSTPLPKSSCARQRLTSPRFLNIYKKLLSRGGEIHQKTDSASFFEYSLEQFSSCGFILKNISLDLHSSKFASENIITEYEKSFSDKGLPIYKLEAVKP